MTESNVNILQLNAEGIMREVERLQAEENPRLLRTFFYLAWTLDVRPDFSLVRVPSEEEMVALYKVSPEVGARMVTAYSETVARARWESL